MPVPPSPQARQMTVRRENDGSPTKLKGASGTPDKQTKAKPVDFGKAIGIDRPANIQAKIKKWQAELGEDSPMQNAAATASEDNVTIEPPPEPQTTPRPKTAEPKPTPSPIPSPTKLPAEGTASPAERPKSAKKPPLHNKLDEDVRIASAPKKRVVSDSNWRNKKSPAKDPTKRPNPKPLPTAWVRPATKPKPKPPPVQTETKPIIIDTSNEIQIGLSSRPRNSTGQRRRSGASTSGNEERPTSSGSGSGTARSGDERVNSAMSPNPDKPYKIVVRSEPRKRRSPRNSLSADEDTPVKSRSARRSRDVIKDSSEERLSGDKPPLLDVASSERRHRRRRSGHRREQSDVSAEDSSKEPISTGRRRRRRSPRQDSGRLGDPAPAPITLEPPPKLPGNRIEAWLGSTPDPFVDGDGRSRRSSKSATTISDLTNGKEEKLDDESTTLTKPDTVSDTVEKHSSGKRRRRKRSSTTHVDTKNLDDEPSIAPTAQIEGRSDSSPLKEDMQSPALKRRGARRTQHSPTKLRAKSLGSRDPLLEEEEDVASTAPSSSVDASTLDIENVPFRTRPDSLVIRRGFPTTGKRLSTIASVETFSTRLQAAPPSETIGSEVGGEYRIGLQGVNASEISSQVNSDTLTVVSRRSTKRKLAKHSDLMTVLSMPPPAGSRSIVSARSVRSNRSRLPTATLGDILGELATDESKYMRELRTLVDGVIPVLLTCVLSKSDSAVAAGLFSRSASKDDPNVTKPIVDMGVALERLKSSHKKISKDDPEAVLSWAQGAQRIYADYLKCWRLGFQDVVVNLAPAVEDPSVPSPTKGTATSGELGAWDEGMPRNKEGYVVNGEGERVDVAFLLKRPLVRLKYLAKTFKGINHIKPSEKAEKVTEAFQNLVAEARKRSNEEHARLEDQAAANIDPTRTRDPRSLALLAGVRIDPNRCVRARDYFDMHLPHSSGQEVHCRVELLLRDEAPGMGTGGDVLLCEVDGTGRWLLFPPIQIGRISARNGDLKGEIVVMIRGVHTGSEEWNEVFSLKTDDEEAGFEWVQMLGLEPVPPRLTELKREESFVSKARRPTSSHASSSLLSAGTASTPPQKSRTPSPREIEVPIGVKANASSKRWSYNTPDRNGKVKSPEVSPVTPPSSAGSIVKRRSGTISPPSPLQPASYSEDGSYTPPLRPADPDDDSLLDRTPRTLNEAMLMAGSGSSTNSLRRTKAKRRQPTESPRSSRPSRQIVLDDPTLEETAKPAKKPSQRKRSHTYSATSSTVSQSTVSQQSKGFSVWLPSSEAEYSDESDYSDDDHKLEQAYERPKRPQPHRRASSVPSLDLPSIPKIRKTSQPTTPEKEQFEERIKDISSSAPSKLEKKYVEPAEDDEPPPVPAHRSPSPATPVTLKASNTPVLTPTLHGFKTKRRSSSPLKHEYEPSTATESSSESEEETFGDDVDSLTSESSEDELEDDVPTPLMPIPQTQRFPKVSPPSSIYTLPNGTITPSQSASNTPYRAVPKGSTTASKTIATVFSWSDATGRWEPVHPDECSIVVTPGKIEAFEVTAAHSKPLMADGDEIIQPEGKTPIVCLELTPLVPLRRGTAVDISMRSPPTSDSRIKAGDQIMFRSRTPDECWALYQLINQARINNPTYIALQNARGPYGQPTSWAAAMDRQNAARSSSGSSASWWNLNGTLGRRSSYRASSTRAASISAATESSVGTRQSFSSALKRFSGTGRFFNIGKSTLSSSRDGSGSINSFDSGSGSGSGRSTPNPDGSGRAANAPAGITNTKIRLYVRETHTKWRDMGSARLTIMLPDPITPQSASRHGAGSPGTRQPGQEKRILIQGKTKGETLLDVTLGESCFERVARTGIALSVWEDVVGPDGQVTVGAIGGVSSAKTRMYMVQMKTERECAYSYSLLGRLRY